MVFEFYYYTRSDYNIADLSTFLLSLSDVIFILFSLLLVN